MGVAELGELALNRATLGRQMLVERARVAVTQAVGSIGALQAQHPASPYLSLWNRIAGFDATDVDAAFDSGRLAKGSMMRITLHVVPGEDYHQYRSAMMPSLRAAGFNDRRFTDTGLSAEEADTLAAGLAECVLTPRTRMEIEAALARLMGREPPAGLWRALRLCAPWRHAPGDHPWRFGDPGRFIGADQADEVDHDRAVAHLVRDYLKAYGPASRRDVAQFTMLRAGPIRAAIERLGDQLITMAGPSDELIDVVDGWLPDPNLDVAPRLLGMWDNLLLAYADRSRVIPNEFRPLVIRRNGDVLASVLVDGYVAGVWRATKAGIEVTPFADFSAPTWSGIEAEAAGLITLLDGRDRFPYRRYDRWFADLPRPAGPPRTVAEWSHR